MSECQRLMKDRGVDEYVRDSNVCTLNPVDRGTCMGDSGTFKIFFFLSLFSEFEDYFWSHLVGGPLITNEGVLVGIVSWGVPCALGYPDIYTGVYKYLDWIQSEMEKHNEDQYTASIETI